MKIRSIINIVATECQPEDEDKFNKWYNEVHIPMLLKGKGIRTVTRYKIVKESEGHPKYLAVYEFENQNAFDAFNTSPELATALNEMGVSWKERKFEVKYQVQYEPIKTWKR